MSEANTTSRRGKVFVAIAAALVTFFMLRALGSQPDVKAADVSVADAAEHPAAIGSPHAGQDVRAGAAGAAAPAPQDLRSGFFPRDPDEWQGMRVDLNFRPFCERKDGCGQALACIDGLCNPCTADSQCASGEVCVLDHCVLSHLVSCRTRRDCASGELCTLSGMTGGKPRGNEDMRAYCPSTMGGRDQKPEDIDLGPGEPAGPALFDADELIESARAHLRANPEAPPQGTP